VGGARHGRSRWDMNRDVPPGLQRTILVAVGGLLGSVGRYGLGGAAQRIGGDVFPTGTLAVNVLGSLLIGLVMTLSLERGLLDDDARILLTTGFCGGFTTMSTFSWETLALLREDEWLLALGNAGSTLLACLVAVWIGIAAARAL
jgi:CrcB protein